MNQLLTRNNLLKAVFFVFVCLVLITRLLIFFTINIHFIDSDQPAMWLGASHYAQGLFYEPRYYGQDYNTFMEALVAVPFINSGLPIYYAVPLATHLIFLVPFFAIAIYLLRKGKTEMAILTLGILLCFPTGFDIMTALPRGFVTGLFFTSFFIVSIHEPQRMGFIVVNSFMAYAGFLVNPNSVIVSVPLLFYIFLLNYKNKPYYAFTLIGFALALPLDFLLNNYYKNHPESIIYPLNNSYSFSELISGIASLDLRFGNAGLFIENKGSVMLIVFLFLGYLSFKQNRLLFYSFLVFIAVVLFSFSSSKVADGTPWPFYSYSRMYIGFPLFIIIFLSGLNLSFAKTIVPLIILITGFTVYKQVNFKNSLASHTDSKKWAFVHLFSLHQIKETISAYKAVCEQQKVNTLIVENGLWCGEILANAGPAIDKDFPYTFKTIIDRQQWRVKQDAGTVFKNFVFVSRNYDFDKYVEGIPHSFKITRLDDYGMFRVDDNSMTNSEFCALVNR